MNPSLTLRWLEKNLRSLSKRFKCGGKGHYAFECPSNKNNKKVMQVTWSDSESNRTSENESNECNEYTNFIAFAASVNEESLLREASSELGD